MKTRNRGKYSNISKEGNVTEKRYIGACYEKMAISSYYCFIVSLLCIG